MAINRMEKVYVIAPRDDKAKILESLQKAGIMHLETNLRKEIEQASGEKEITSQEIELKISQAEYVIDYLKKFEKKQSIVRSLEKLKNIIKYDDFAGIEKNFSLDEAYGLARRSKDLLAREGDLHTRLARLEPFKALTVRMEEIRNTPHVIMRIGSVAESAFQALQLDLEEITKAHTIVNIAGGFQQKDYFFLAYHRQHHDDIEKALLHHNFRDEDPRLKGTVGEEIDGIHGQLGEIEKEKAAIGEESVKAAEQLDTVKLYYDYLLNARDRKRAEGYVYETRSTFIIKGWVREIDASRLEELLSAITPGFEIIRAEPGEGDSIPVKMHNPSLLSPMEFVTDLYGTPRHDEYDPTPHIFAFFVLFFSVCLTDAGYAIMLLILSLVLLRFMGNSKLLRVLLYGSVLTIITGFIAGGWWGIPYDSLPLFFQKYSINVGEKSLEFLSFTLFLGIAQMTYGLFLGARMCWEKGQTADAWDRIIKGVFFLSGSMLGVMGGLLARKFPEPYQSILTKICLFAGAAFLIFQFVRTIVERKPEENIVFTLFRATVTESVLSLLNTVVGFLGVLLSYSRLMALGLSTGGIGMVINLLAGLTLSLIPIPGVSHVIALLILVLGHTFNLVISTLGAFVHTARLQYVEFFPYFFEGGGRRFTPFAIKTKYCAVETSST